LKAHTGEGFVVNETCQQQGQDSTYHQEGNANHLPISDGMPLNSTNTAHESAQKLNTKNNRLIEEKKEANLCKAHLS
jgi:hypothetical protein